ncbi:MAG TPA: hypothetical protein VHZ52_08220 [Acidobacteriaceae bacterium]|jgi:hypothetical protein|nr:hypothetical protein [Acidobacteriaceae bacterium]
MLACANVFAIPAWQREQAALPTYSRAVVGVAEGFGFFDAA